MKRVEVHSNNQHAIHNYNNRTVQYMNKCIKKTLKHGASVHV